MIEHAQCGAKNISPGIMLVDDDPHMIDIYSTILRPEGFEDLIAVKESEAVLPVLKAIGHKCGLIILDLVMPGISGMELLKAIAGDFPHIPVIIATGTDKVVTAVECMKLGAADYLVKPVSKERLVSTVKKTLETGALRIELDSLRDCLIEDRLKNEEAFSSIITRNQKMRQIFKYVEAISDTPASVLITGETGTGKELIANVIHELSGRRGSFVAVNVAGLDDNMFSDTLFGHKRGAFTGADDQREGMIAKAEAGTLFLDEIGDLSGQSQVRLLRLLQENAYYPLGSDIAKKSNARIIVATNKDLQELIRQGKFRKDLYYRLGAHRLHLPPLRERIEDLPMLIEHFLQEASLEYSLKKPFWPPELIKILAKHYFPGNIRELRAMVFDAVIVHKTGDSDSLSIESFKGIVSGDALQTEQKALPDIPADSLALMYMIFGRFPTFDEVEGFLITEAMNLSKGNQSLAATYLGITRQTLNKRLKSRNEKKDR